MQSFLFTELLGFLARALLLLGGDRLLQLRVGIDDGGGLLFVVILQ